jgi:formylglycine-generating enzyme required for sulfatase activity
MPDAKNRPLKVFLCHAHEDKATVRDLYRQLCAEGWLDVWLDEEKLLPGQEWDIEIEKAVEAADVVLVCLSCRSVDKEGYIQKEMRFVLNIAEEKPEGTIFVIPLKLENCEVPRRLRAWHWVDYFPKDNRAWAYQRLLESLKLRAARLGISTTNQAEDKARLEVEEAHARRDTEEKAKKEKEVQDKKALEEFEQILAKEKARQEREARERKAAKEKALKKAQRRQFKFNIRTFALGISLLCFFIAGIGIYNLIKNWLGASSPVSTAPFTPTPPVGSTWTRPADGMVMVYVLEGDFTMGSNTNDVEKPIHTVYLDAFWIDQTEVTNKMYALCVAAGKCNPPSDSSSYTRSNYYGNSEYDDYPVIYVSWNDASAYCAWAGSDVYGVRLPTEAEWEKAARGTDGRTYPWGEGIDCQKANYNGSCVGDTSLVGSYESGKSPYGVYDLAGNVWEWVADWYSANYYSTLRDGVHNPTGPASGDYRVLRGGSWLSYVNFARSAFRYGSDPTYSGNYFGFRCSRSR